MGRVQNFKYGVNMKKQEKCYLTHLSGVKGCFWQSIHTRMVGEFAPRNQHPILAAHTNHEHKRHTIGTQTLSCIAKGKLEMTTSL